MQENDFFENGAPQKAATLLLQKNNWCVEAVTLKKFEDITSPKRELSWKIR